MGPGEDELLARLQRGDLPLSMPPHGEHVIRFAIRNLMPRLLDALLAAGMDPNAREPHDDPPLHEAIAMWETGRHGWAGEAAPRMMLALIRAGADLNARGANDYTALHAAAARGSARMCEQLMDAGADPLIPAEAWDEDAGQTPYELADFYGRKAVATAIRARVSAEALNRRAAERQAARERFRAKR